MNASANPPVTSIAAPSAQLPDGTNTIVRIDGLTMHFGTGATPALDNLSAQILTGRITGLVGPDGAGKTTLLRLIAGLLKPTAGSIHADGFDTVRETAALHGFLGYMPQRFGLYEDLSVIENLRLYADLQGVVGTERTEVFARLLEFTSLAPFQSRLAGRLSGGMKQKLGLACALLRRPRLLLLDEPSVGVDPLSRRELWRMVRELADKSTAIVWSTAYLDEAERCDAILLLNSGRLLYSGDPQDMTARVKGRSFLIEGGTECRRSILSRALVAKAVRDGVIQGSRVRIVTARGEAVPSAQALGAGEGARVLPAPPRFEDAFVDALEGEPHRESLLAQRMPRVQTAVEAVVQAEGLTKQFGDFTAARDISFAIAPGRIFGLLGPNGAGKSTTFKMLCGLLQPSAGRASVNGVDLQRAPGEARSHIGYMAQKFSLYGGLSVAQNLRFFAGAYGLGGRARKATIESMVEIFELQPQLQVSAELLPLGFKQRLALACAVMHNPAVLFLDEPTSGVDPLTRREFWRHINGMVEKGVTIVVTTHFMEEAEYCDEIALVYRGRIIAGGSPDALKQHAQQSGLTEPTLEDAFIELVERFDRENA